MPTRVVIPKSFELGANKWMVKFILDLMHDGDACNGLTLPEDLLIQLDKREWVDNDQLTHVFMHELVHAILGTMGRDDLYEDEAFVDLFAHLLCQAFKTSKGILK